MKARLATKPAVAPSMVVEALRSTLDRRHVGAQALLEDRASLASRESPVSYVELRSFRSIDENLLLELVTSLMAMLHSSETEFWLWIAGTQDGRLRFRVGQQRSYRNNLQRSLAGMIKGADVVRIEDDEYDRLMKAIDSAASSAAEYGGCLVVGVPSERQDTPVETRLDEALEAVVGTEFDIVIRFTPLSHEFLDPLEGQLAAIVNAADALQNSNVTKEDRETFEHAFSHAATRMRREITNTGDIESDVDSNTKTAPGAAIFGAAGAVLGAIVGAVAGGPQGAIVGANAGASIGGLASDAINGRKQQANKVEHIEEDRRETVAEKAAREETSKRNHGSTSFQISFHEVGRQAKEIVDLANAHLERVRTARALGAFDVTAFVGAETRADAEIVAHALVGALRGDTSHLEPLRVIPMNDASARSLQRGLLLGSKPEWKVPPSPLPPLSNAPSTWLTTAEAAHWMRPPAHPIVGVTVLPNLRFSRIAAAVPEDRRLPIGSLMADGRAVAPFSLHLDDMTRHTFVAGTTGSGKTTTVRSILLQMAERGVPFMVVEPAKSEYRELFEHLRARTRHLPENQRPVRLVVGRANPGAGEDQLCFNPLRPIPGLPVQRYADQIKQLMMSCFDTSESLPQLVERVVLRAYERSGLRLASMYGEGGSTAASAPPTMHDLAGRSLASGHELTIVDEVLQWAGYHDEADRAFRAALRVRLDSFTLGIKSRLFVDDFMRPLFPTVLNRPCFVELSELSESYVRRFVLGALVLQIYGYREAAARRVPSSVSSGTRHLLVLEEAHHFLREPGAHRPGGEIIRQANEMLTDALAELRSYGQAILIADQSPAELAPAVLRNTNTKIAHALKYEADCRAMGDAMGLDDEQCSHLRRLAPGECVVSSPRLPSAIECRITPPSYSVLAGAP